MNLRTRLFSSFALLVLLGCGAQRPEIASLPPDLRATWDRCEPAVTRWCAEHSHGSPVEERNCVGEASNHFATHADEAARTTYLRSHGCSM
jgi:hypothetical protein